MFLRVLADAMNNKRRRKIVFSGRPCHLIEIEKTDDRTISALCEYSGRALNLAEIFHDPIECDKRFYELKQFLPKKKRGEDGYAEEAANS